MEDLIYRTEFVEALRLLGRACGLASRDHEPPVLVGGAVVEMDTAGAYTSGDFDFVTSADDVFAAALREVGFVQDTRPGKVRRRGGWFHPERLVGVDMVSGTLFDGRTDRSRLRTVDLGGGSLVVPPAEDMIADRLGQWEASDRRDAELLEQARAMYRLVDELDHAYLERRIREETGGMSGPQVLLDQSGG